MIATLEAYAKKGEYPFGTEPFMAVSMKDPHYNPNQPLIHRFIGPSGKLCAVAHLMAQSGKRDLIDAIAKSNNHFCVGMEKNRDVEKWILSSGLTIEECIAIQRPAPPPTQRLEVQDLITKQLTNPLLQIISDLKKNSKKSLKVAEERYRAANDPARS